MKLFFVCSLFLFVSLVTNCSKGQGSSTKDAEVGSEDQSFEDEQNQNPVYEQDQNTEGEVKSEEDVISQRLNTIFTCVAECTQAMTGPPGYTKFEQYSSCAGTSAEAKKDAPEVCTGLRADLVPRAVDCNNTGTACQ